MSDYPMLISNKLHSFRNFKVQNYEIILTCLIFNHFFIKIRRGRRILYVFVLVQNEFPPPRTEKEFFISFLIFSLFLINER